MKLKLKDIKPDHHQWHRAFVLLPKRTEDRFIVFCGFVWRRYKPMGLAIAGDYIYSVTNPHKK